MRKIYIEINIILCMERIEIQKDCCLCDVCNKPLTNGEFIALEDSTWFEGWLYCNDCKDKYNPTMKIIMPIFEGDDLSQTDLARPMIMEFGS